jgi:C1A family cysteine protease
MENKFVLNVKKSPKDKKDYIYIGGNISVPQVLDYRSDLQPVRNQGSQGTCYAQTVACVKEWQEKKDSGFNEYMSPQFFYNNRLNKYDTDPTNDYGMFGRDVMKMMQSIGICRESNYPYGKIENKDAISPSCFDEAKKYLIKSYAQVTSVDTLKQSLVSNGPCLITFPVYNNGQYFWRKTGDQKLEGGHAVTVVGYDNDGFIIRNSWGSDWGDHGYTRYRYNEWGAHWEIWTTVDIIEGGVYVPTSKKLCCNIL